MAETPGRDNEPIRRGERAPDFALPRDGDHAVRFYGVAGGVPTVLVLTAGADAETRARLARRLGDQHEVHVVVPSATVQGIDGVFHDPDGKVHEAYGVAVDGPPVTAALDPNLRVVAVRAEEDPDAVVPAVRDALTAVEHRGSGITIARQAPVLLVPDVLDAAWCARLRERWAASGGQATGVEASADGARAEVADQHRKRRRDHTVTDSELLRELTSAIGRRLMPELQQAFAYRATRFEGFKIGCYEAGDRGFFESHRDNLSPATAHRRFALTLNLNDEYDGGELRFPEYSQDRYRPDAGAALVFSGSLLHEVLPVTRGRRFVLLSFLFHQRRR